MLKYPKGDFVWVRRRGDRVWLLGEIVGVEDDFRLVHRSDNRIMMYTIESLARHEARHLEKEYA